jgi:hypothetical protein
VVSDLAELHVLATELISENCWQVDLSLVRFRAIECHWSHLAFAGILVCLALVLALSLRIESLVGLAS